MLPPAAFLIMRIAMWTSVYYGTVVMPGWAHAISLILMAVDLWMVAHLGACVLEHFLQGLETWRPSRRFPASTALRRAFVNAAFEMTTYRARTNPHNIAAARRASARKHLEAFAGFNGMSPYMISMSNADVNSGLAGERRFHDVKDLISYDDFRRDTLPVNPIVGLIDVDYHLNADEIADVLGCGHPVFIYTLDPKDIAATSDDVHTCYAGGEEWEYKVPDSIYKHKLWDWGGEHRLIVPKASRYVGLVRLILDLLPLIALCAWLFAVAELWDEGVYMRPSKWPFWKGGCAQHWGGLHYPTANLRTFKWHPWADWGLPDADYNITLPYVNVTSNLFRPRWDFSSTLVPCRTATGFGWNCLKHVGSLLHFMLMAAIIKFAGKFMTTFLLPERLLVRVEKKPVGAGRTMVLVIPERQVTAAELSLRTILAGFRLRAQPAFELMRRLAPTELSFAGNKYHAMEVVAATGNYFTIGELGTGVSWRLTYDQVSAVRGIVRQVGKIPSGTTVKDALRRAGLEITSEEAGQVACCVSAMTDDIMHVSYLMRHGSPMLVYRLGPDPGCTPLVPTLRPYMNHFIDGGAYVPSVEPTNMAAGIDIRVKRNRNTTTPDSRDMRIGEDFLSFALSEVRSQGYYRRDLYTAEEVMIRQHRPTQLAQLLEPIHASPPEELKTDYRAFVKPAETTAKPRIITIPKESTFKFHSSRVGYVVAAAMKFNHWNFSGLNFREVADRIVKTFAHAKTETELDVSNMDASHGALELEMFRRYVLAVTKPCDHAMVHELMAATFFGTVKSNGGKYCQGYVLGSGLWLTTVFNTFSGALHAYRMRRKLLSTTETREHSYDRLGGHSGDDSIMLDTPTADEVIKAYATAGLKVKVKRFNAGSRQVSFLARVYDTRDGSSVCDMARVLKKAHLTGLPDSVSNNVVASMRWSGIAFCDLDNGIFGDIARYVLERVDKRMLGCIERARGGSRTDADEAIERAGQAHDRTVNSAVRSLGYRQVWSLLDCATPINADWADEHLLTAIGPAAVGEIIRWMDRDGAWDNPPIVAFLETKPALGFTGSEVNGTELAGDGVEYPHPPEPLHTCLASASRALPVAAPARATANATVTDNTLVSPIPQLDMTLGASPGPAPMMLGDKILEADPQLATAAAAVDPDPDPGELSQLETLRAYTLPGATEPQLEVLRRVKPRHSTKTLEEIRDEYKGHRANGPLERARHNRKTRSTGAEGTSRIPWTVEEKEEFESYFVSIDAHHEARLLCDVARLIHPPKK